MADLPEELEFELEALQATYGAEAVHVGRSAGAAVTVSLPLAPRVESEHERFVAARLVLGVGPSYPREPAQAQLADAKGALAHGRAYMAALHAAQGRTPPFRRAGELPSTAPQPRAHPVASLRAPCHPPCAGLSDEQLRGLAGALAREAAALAGELSLGQLVETGLELLSAANRPHGPCAFCLEPLAPGGGAGSCGSGGAVLRLACYHCYHT